MYLADKKVQIKVQVKKYETYSKFLEMVEEMENGQKKAMIRNARVSEGDYMFTFQLSRQNEVWV